MIMLELLLPFKKFLKFDEVRTDNNIFRLHYRITVMLLVVFTLLVTTKQFFGDPIHCMGDDNKNKDAINSFCWTYGTYTLRSSLVGRVGVDVIQQGVGPSRGIDDIEIKHTYYQWVCFVLMGQAIMFYFPRYLWKIWEGGRLKALTAGLTCPVANKGLDKYQNRRKEVVDYLSCSNLNVHKMYALKFAFCELLNLINVIMQLFLMDVFLGGSFHNYGAAVAAFSKSDTKTPNPMDRVFPKLTKCAFNYYGASGSVQTIDRLCVLPLNIVNEKIFAVMWFWIIILICLSSICFIYRILLITLPQFRTHALMSQVRCVNRNIVSKLVNRCNYGDWFVLHSLGKNINPVIYKTLILELADELNDDATYSKVPIISCENK